MNKISSTKATCKLCLKELSITGGQTSGLKRHLETQHTVNLSKDDEKQPKLLMGHRPVSATRADKIDKMIGKFIAENMLPMSTVESAAFRELIGYLEPQYKVPCRQTITGILQQMQNELKTKVETDLATNKLAQIALTTDIWTSLTNEAYLSVTASYVTDDWKLKTPVLATFPMEERHTADYIAQCLKVTTDDWGITQRISTVVHDGAANIKEVGHINNWGDVYCAAHKLHLIVSSSLGVDKVNNNPISRCIGAASRLVGHFNHSCLATSELMKRQQSMDASKPSRKLIQHVKTRWNSVFDMMERLTELRWPVLAVLSDRTVTKLAEAKTLDMKEEHWTLIEELLPVLRPLQVVTSLFSAEQSPSASTVYPTLWKLIKREFAPADSNSSTIAEFKVGLLLFPGSPRVQYFHGREGVGAILVQ